MPRKLTNAAYEKWASLVALEADLTHAIDAMKDVSTAGAWEGPHALSARSPYRRDVRGRTPAVLRSAEGFAFRAKNGANAQITRLAKYRTTIRGVLAKVEAAHPSLNRETIKR